jgi:hypothetical protein
VVRVFPWKFFKGLGFEVGKLFQRDQGEEKMVYPTSRLINLLMKWTMISKKNGLEYVLGDQKGKKESRGQMIS